MTYEQSTGRLVSDSGWLFGTGYAGNGEGKNNPKFEQVKNVGPLPRGRYKIGVPYNSKHTGAFTLPLTPDENNKMYGRSAFCIHGDSISEPGTASNGCIILPRKVREEISMSTDKQLIVI